MFCFASRLDRISLPTLDLPRSQLVRSIMTEVAAAAASSSLPSSNPPTISKRPKPPRQPKHKHTSYVAVVAFLLPRPADEGVTPAVSHRVGKLDEIRQKWDAAATRWVPHITLIPPFVVPFEQEEEEEDGRQQLVPSTDSTTTTTTTAGNAATTSPPGPRHEAAYAALRQLTERIQAALAAAAVPRHRLVLDDVGVFKLSRYWNVHLRPRGLHDGDKEARSSAASTPAEEGRHAFVEMQRVLQEALPETKEAERGGNAGRERGRGGRGGRGGGGRAHRERPFSPHASLGQAYHKKQLEELKALGLELCAPHEEGSLDEALAGLTLGKEREAAGGRVEDGPAARGIDVEVASIALMAKPKGREGAYDVFSTIEIG